MSNSPSGEIYLVFTGDDWRYQLIQFANSAGLPITYFGKLKNTIQQSMLIELYDNGVANRFGTFFYGGNMTRYGFKWGQFRTNWLYFLSSKEDLSLYPDFSILIDIESISPAYYLDSVTSALSSQVIKYTSTSYNANQAIYEEYDWSELRYLLEDAPPLELNLLKNTTYSTSHANLTDLFATKYGNSCPLTPANTIPFRDLVVNSTLFLSLNSTIPTWASIGGSDELYISDIPTSFNLTPAYLLVNAYNTHGESINSTLTVKLNNYSPYNVTPAIDFTRIAGSANFTYDVSAMFADIENQIITVSYKESVSNATVLWITVASNIFSIKTTTVADVTINMKASDVYGASIVIPFKVNITNIPPQVIGTAPDTFWLYENVTVQKSYNFSNYFQEFDAIHTLAYSLTGKPSFVANITSGPIFNLTVSPALANVGNYTIGFVATDGFASATVNLTFEVKLNNPPSPPTNVTIEALEGIAGTHTVPFFTDTEGDAVTYAWVLNGTSNNWNTLTWLSVNLSSMTITYNSTSSSAAVNILKITGKDIYNTASFTLITINTNKEPIPNPSYTSLSRTFIAQYPSNFSLPGSLFSDESPSTLTFSATYENGTALGTWFSLTVPAAPPAGTFLFNATYPIYSEVYFTIRVTATDIKGLKDFIDIDIKVEAVWHSTWLEWFGPGPNDCTLWYEGRFLETSAWRIDWFDGKYPEDSINEWVQCNSACETCSGPSNEDCIEWFSNSTLTYYQFEGECGLTCPSGYYGSIEEKSCKKWHAFWTECYGSLNSQCTEWDEVNRYTLSYIDTCQYLEWPELTYYDESTYSWVHCSSSCKNWDGPDTDDWTDCAYSRFLNSLNQCQTWTEINSGLKFAPIENTCIEQWGKGFNLGFVEWDDGNKDNGDGWSEFCTTESGWKCENGTSTTPDIWGSLISPEWVITSISSETHLMKISCTETVKFNEIDNSDLSIEIDGPLSPYKFDYVIDSSTDYIIGAVGSSFGIQFEFLSSLYGDLKETITITIHNNQILEDLDGNYLKTVEMKIKIPFYLTVLTSEEKRVAQAQSGFSIVTMLLTFGTSFFIQVVLGGTIEATWLLLGTLQLMSFLPLLNLNLPANFREFNKNLAVLNGEPGFLPNIFEAYYDSLGVEIKPYNRYFEMMNFKTEYLLLNAGRKIELWLLVFFISAISFIIFDMFGEAKKVGGLITKIDTKLRYGFIIRGVSQSYLSMVVSSCLNVVSVSWSGNVSFMSNLIALVSAVVMIYVPIISYNIIHKTPNLEDERFKQRFKTFVIDLKTSNPLWFQFIVVFFFRRAVYASTFVIISSIPIGQVCFLSLSVLGMAVYLVLVRPYKSSLSQILSLINEFLLTSMIAIWGRFINPVITPSTSSIIGNTLGAILIFTIFINWTGIIIYGVSMWIKARIEKKKKMNLEKYYKANKQSRLYNNIGASELDK